MMKIILKTMIQNSHKPGVVVQACNSSTREAEAGGAQVWGRPGLQSELEANLAT
jgi:hypothetical protein